MTRYVIDRYEQAERFFWSNISLETAQINGTEVFTSGVNNKFLNCAIQRRPLAESTFQDTFDNISTFYNSHHIPWVWIIREDLIEPGFLPSIPLPLLDKSTMMFCKLDEPIPEAFHSKLQILENNQNLTDWGICLSQAYEPSTQQVTPYSQATQQYILAHQKESWGKTKFHHFVAYVDKAPVSCLTLSLQNGMARLDDVGTIPSQQKKGYATELIIHVLNYAKHLGADICFLESSQAGIKMYQRIGFSALYSNMYFGINSD